MHDEQHTGSMSLVMHRFIRLLDQAAIKRNVPPILIRHLVLGVILFLPGAGLIALWFFSFLIDSIPYATKQEYRPFLLILGISFLLYVSASTIFLTSRVRRRVNASRGFACPWCLYDLRGRREEASCPECGHSIDTERLPKMWHGYLKQDRRGSRERGAPG